ncbi:MAG TPA: AsmA-like C-terminal region-containing protein [Geminicoccaceae bacterium]|nr:AsmA-like C-terminal region-containing protein [Geminicoccaceae bacterium]
MLRALLTGLLIAAGLALIGLTVLYSLLDADDYRADIAATVGALTGREARIDGRIEVSLLPRPTVSVARASLASRPDDADGAFDLTVDRLDLRVAAWPLLLLGELEVHEALLVRPVLTLDRPPERPLDLLASPAAAAGEGPRPRAVQLGQLVVADGTLIVGGGEEAGAGRRRVEAINLDLRAEPDGGRLVLAGDFREGERLYSLAAELGRLDERRGAPLRLELAAQDGRSGGVASASYRGIGRLGDAGPELRGELRAEGNGLRHGIGLADALLYGDGAAGVDGGAAAAPATATAGPLADPFALGGRLELTPAALRLDELSVRLGDGEAAGRLALALGAEPRLDLTLRASNLALPAPSAAALDLAAWPLPPRGLTGAVDVTAASASAGGGTLRGLRLTLGIADGRVAVERATALLPGGTDVAFTGTFGPTGAGAVPELSGALRAGTDNLRALLDWLGVETGAVPPGRLRTLAFTGDVALSPQLVRFSRSELRFDASTVRGSLAAGLGPRRRLAVAVTLDRLNADAYLPEIAPAAAAPERPDDDSAEPEADGAAPPPARWLPEPWRELALGFDAAVEVTLERLTWRGQRLQDVRLRGRLEEGRLTLDDLAVADLAELNLSVSGAADLRREDVDVAFTVATERPERALRLLGYNPPPMVARFAPVRLEGTADGPLGAAAVELEVRAGEVELALSGEAGGGAPGAARLDASWQAAHPDLPGLLDQLGVPLAPEEVAALSGPVRLAGGVGLAPERARDVRFAGTLGPMAIDGGLSWRAAAEPEPRPGIGLRLGAEPLVAEILSPLLSAAGGTGGLAAFTPGNLSRRPLGAEDLRALDLELEVTTGDLRHGGRSLGPLALSAALADGTLDLRRLETKPFGGDLAVRGRVITEGPLAEVELSLTLDRVEAGALLELLGLPPAVRGPADVRVSATTAGRSAYDLVGGLAGEMELRIRGGRLSGVAFGPIHRSLTGPDRPSPVQVRQSLLGGETPFALFGGVFDLDRGVLRAADLGAVLEAGGVGTVEGAIDLLFWAGDLTLELSPDGSDGLPPVGLRLVGPLGQPQRVPQLQALEAYLAAEAPQE